MKNKIFIISLICLIFLVGCSTKDTTSTTIFSENSVSKETNLDSNDILWIGEFPLNKSLISDISKSFKNKNGEICSILYNKDFEIYEEEKMDLVLKVRGYVNFNSEIERQNFSTAKTFNAYYKITTEDNKSYIEYVICLTYPNLPDDCLIIKCEKNGKYTELKDFSSLKDFVENYMIFGINKYPVNEFQDFSKKNINPYITVEEIDTLIQKQLILNNEIFGNDNTLPLDIIHTTPEELKKGYRRVDTENTTLYNFEKLSEFIREVWIDAISQNLLFFPNGKTYFYEKSEINGGIIAIEEVINLNPYYKEENGILYSSAVNEYVSEYNIIDKYNIEIISANEEYCCFKKWYRNPEYGIKGGDKYETEFLFYEALLKKENNLWKFALISTNPAQYNQYKNIFEYYDSIKEDNTQGYSNIF